MKVIGILMLLMLLIGGSAARSDSGLWVILAEALIFLLTAVLPFCRRREGLWIFLLSVPLLLPSDIRLFYEVFYYRLVEVYPCWLCVLCGVETTVALLSGELILVCTLAGILWKKQRIFGT